MEGTPYCLLSSAVMSSSLTNPSFTRIEAELAPVGLLVGQHFLELLGGDALLFEKQFADPDGHVTRASVSDSVQNITWADEAPAAARDRRRRLPAFDKEAATAPPR